MRKLLLVVAIILVVGATFFITKEKGVVAPEEEVAHVTKVIDGDTIEVEGGRRVRYIGMDTPEMTACFGPEATVENTKLVNGKTVRLISDVADKDTYGRLLRYVYVGNEFINEELVTRGFAVAEPIKPDTLFADQFLQAQNEAKLSGSGLWSACKNQ